MLVHQPPGFCQKSLETSLGRLVYYTQSPDFWEPSPRSSEAAIAAPDDRPSGDRPTWVFLHSLGGGSSAFEWSGTYAALASEVRVLAPDLVGWGASAHPARDYRPDDYLQEIAEFVEAAAEPPVWVAASSLTGGLTVRLAIARPELFRGLVLSCPSGLADFGLDYGSGPAAWLAALPGVDRALYALGAANEVAVRNFLERFLFGRPERISPAIVAAYLASAQQPNAEYAALSSLRGDLCFDLAGYLPQLRLPTAFLWGTEARFSSLETGKRLAALNPDWVRTLRAIPTAGVLPHLELPGPTASLLRAIARSLTSPLP